MTVMQAPVDFDMLRQLFHERFETLSPHLKRIAQYALDDPNSFALQTVADIARETGVQPSSLVRFAKGFGYSGFSEMQRVFRVRLIEGATTYREQIHSHRGKLEEVAEDDPAAILSEFAEASRAALEQLQENINAPDLKHAVQMLEAADTVYVIGQRRAFPVAAYMAYGLSRLEYRCHLLDSVGGMVPQQVAAMNRRDLLFAVSFAEYAPAVVDVVKDVHIRGIPVLTVTDTGASPLAVNATLSFPIRDADVHRFRPLAPAIVLVQSLIIALGYVRDARLKSPTRTTD